MHLFLLLFLASQEPEALSAPSIGLEVVSRDEPAVQEILKGLTKVPDGPQLFATYVATGGPSDSAGVSYGNLIRAVGKTRCKSVEEFEAAIQAAKLGEEVEIELFQHRVAESGRDVWDRRKLKIKTQPRKSVMLAAVAAERDDVSGLTRYKHKKAKEFRAEAAAVPFIVNSGDSWTLYFGLSITHNAGFGLREALLKAGDYEVKYDRPIDQAFNSTIHKNLTVTQWFVVPAGDVDLAKLRARVYSQPVVLRCYGLDGYFDHEVGVAESQVIWETIDAFRVLKGDE